MQCPGTRITERAAEWIRSFLRNGMTIRAIQKLTGIHWDTIRKLQSEMMIETLEVRKQKLLAEGYHASSAAGCVTTDEKLGKWAYWGWLKDVAKTDSLPEPTEGDEEPMAEFATAIADSGSTVNMRTKAKSTATLVERVPLGARVEVLGTCGSWTKVKFGSRTGYMMTKFLIAEDDQEPDEDLTLEERVTRLEKRVAMLEAYDGAVG